MCICYLQVLVLFDLSFYHSVSLESSLLSSLFSLTCLTTNIILYICYLHLFIWLVWLWICAVVISIVLLDLTFFCYVSLLSSLLSSLCYWTCWRSSCVIVISIVLFDYHSVQLLSSLSYCTCHLPFCAIVIFIVILIVLFYLFDYQYVQLLSSFLVWLVWLTFCAVVISIVLFDLFAFQSVQLSFLTCLTTDILRICYLHPLVWLGILPLFMCYC